MSCSGGGGRREEKKQKQKQRWCINDHPDILVEVLQRLDERSLGVAACVCRLWCSISRNDSLWESLCFSHVSPPPPSEVRPVVLAMGGYRRLYVVCLRRVLSRRRRVLGWSRNEVQLSMSLFSIDYYERLGLGGGVEASTSLKFLCKPVNVS